MPEYVYALHDFAPENPDEVSFKIGEKIEVIEKDDLYQDGWWQVSEQGCFCERRNPPTVVAQATVRVGRNVWIQSCQLIQKLGVLEGCTLLLTS